MSDEYVSITRAIAWVLWRDQAVFNENAHPLERLLAWPTYPPAGLVRSNDSSNDLFNKLKSGAIRASGRLNGGGQVLQIGCEQWGELERPAQIMPNSSSAINHPDSLVYNDHSTFWSNVKVSMMDLQNCFTEQEISSRKIQFQIQKRMAHLLSEKTPEIRHGYKKEFIQMLSTQMNCPFETVKVYSRPAFEAYEKQNGKKI